MLAKGRSARSFLKPTWLLESLNMKCLKVFTSTVVNTFEKLWLRLPNAEELRDIESISRILGFSSCAGVVDCPAWTWDNCPTSWQGLYKGKDRKPTVSIEVVIDESLRIWELMFGTPGLKNDKTVLDNSTLFNNVCNGYRPLYRFHMNLCIKVLFATHVSRSGRDLFSLSIMCSFLQRPTK